MHAVLLERYGPPEVLRLTNLPEPRPGQRVLIHGASGAVGCAALQIARLHNTTVDAVCGPAHLDLVRSLGATQAYDYTRENPPISTYDIVFDAAGKLSHSSAAPWLRPGGRFLSVQKGFAKDRPEDHPHLQQWMRDGLLRPVIDRILPLSAIADAHHLVDSGHKTGALVIRIPQPP